MKGISGFAGAARALAHRDYAIYTAGSSVSLIGTWMQRVAVGWLAWELTASPAWLGIVALADLLPAVLAAPLAGAIADRSNRLRLMALTQLLAMTQAGALAALSAVGVLGIHGLVAMTALMGMISAFNQAVHQTLTPAFVPRADLTAAIAVNSISFNVARFIGPAAAGAVLVSGGAALAFACNAVSYLALLLALAAVRPSAAAIAPAAGAGGGSLARDLADGFVYVARHRGIGPLLLLFFGQSLLARPLIELLPGVAAQVYGHGAGGLAAMTSCLGLGALLGGLRMAGGDGGVAGMTRAVLGAHVGLGVVVVAMMTLAQGVAGLAGMVAVGFCMATAGVGTQTLLQLAVASAQRGRVLSLYSVVMRGGPALGALAVGVAGDWWGLRLPLGSSAALALAVALPAWRGWPGLARALDSDRPTASVQSFGVSSSRR